MDAAQFDVAQQKQLIRTLDGAWAFVPAPLPPILDHSRLTEPLAAAAVAIGELKGAARRLQNPYMLIDPLQKREALTSSAMEGTITTLGDLVLEEADAGQPKNDDAKETLNYVRALKKASAMIKELPISHRLIRAAHAVLLQGLSPARGAGKRPGEYKIHQNAVGKIGESIHSAKYVPPPPADTMICMDQLESYINREGRTPADSLIDLALVHYQFEAIHPFADGNGRIGRMLITLMAQQTGLLDLPLLHMSPCLEINKDEYVDKLYAVSTKGQWEEWVSFFLANVEQSCLGATETVDRILNLQTYLGARAREAGKSPRLPMIVDTLFGKSWTTAAEVQKLCKVTFPTAQRDLKALVSCGILVEIRRRTPRIYYAPEILALSERNWPNTA